MADAGGSEAQLGSQRRRELAKSREPVRKVWLAWCKRVVTRANEHKTNAGGSALRVCRARLDCSGVHISAIYNYAASLCSMSRRARVGLAEMARCKRQSYHAQAVRRATSIGGLSPAGCYTGPILAPCISLPSKARGTCRLYLAAETCRCLLIHACLNTHSSRLLTIPLVLAVIIHNPPSAGRLFFHTARILHCQHLVPRPACPLSPRSTASDPVGGD